MSYSLLAADDESLEREAVAFFIEKLGLPLWPLHFARDGEEALRAALAHRPDIVLMDIRMPGMDGIEASIAIRRALPETTIVFLTAFDEFEYARAALKARAEDYLLKPVSAEAFGEAMRGAIAAVEEIRRVGSGRLLAPAQAPAGDLLPGGADSRGGAAELLVAKVRGYIEDHYAESLGLDEACALVGLSRSHFCRLFKAVAKVNFSDCLADRRIAAARELLADPRLGLKEISARVGYADPEYFASLFRRRVGSSPREYRAAHIRLPEQSGREKGK